MEKYVNNKNVLIFLLVYGFLFLFMILGGFSIMGLSFALISGIVVWYFINKGGKFSEIEKRTNFDMIEKHPWNNYSEHDNPWQVGKAKKYR